MRNDLHGQLQPLDLGRLRKHGRSILYGVGQAEVDILQLQMARFDFREVQDVVDHTQQVAPRGLHGFRPDALLGCQIAVDQQLVHAQHTVHGRAYFVAHGGQKFALGPTGRFGGVLCEQQFCSALNDLVLKVVAVVGQAFVTLLNLLQHVVESKGQRVQFSDVAR